jgi:hypothetical protein
MRWVISRRVRWTSSEGWFASDDLPHELVLKLLHVLGELELASVLNIEVGHGDECWVSANHGR